MTAEIGRRLGFDDDQLHCLCEAAEHEDKYTGEIPDAIIEEMWRRLTDPRWSLEQTFDRMPCQQSDKLLMTRETFDEMVRGDEEK
jgi:hypothetical protein